MKKIVMMVLLIAPYVVHSQIDTFTTKSDTLVYQGKLLLLQKMPHETNLVVYPPALFRSVEVTDEQIRQMILDQQTLSLDTVTYSTWGIDFWQTRTMSSCKHIWWDNIAERFREDEVLLSKQSDLAGVGTIMKRIGIVLLCGLCCLFVLNMILTEMLNRWHLVSDNKRFVFDHLGLLLLFGFFSRSTLYDQFTIFSVIGASWSITFFAVVWWGTLLNFLFLLPSAYSQWKKEGRWYAFPKRVNA